MNCAESREPIEDAGGTPSGARGTAARGYSIRPQAALGCQFLSLGWGLVNAELNCLARAMRDPEAVGDPSGAAAPAGGAGNWTGTSGVKPLLLRLKPAAQSGLVPGRAGR